MNAKLSDKEVISKTAEFLKQKFQNDSTGHDWWHLYRVRQNALAISKHYPNVDLEVVQLGALLHDIADWKFSDGDFEASSKAARVWLESLGVAEGLILKISEVVDNVSFKGAGVQQPKLSLEAQIVQDADRLDAIGAIGIARVFAYGSYVKKPMYDPEIKPRENMNIIEYIKSNKESTSINHFYEKLLLVKDRLNTAAAKTIAAERHKFMQVYLAEFYKEWEGKE